jgi:predicted TIM-barrel fold metal-dependent hydrolase
MLPATTKIYSADDHLIEPANLWTDRVPAAYRDRAPKIIEIDGREAWTYEDRLYFLTMGSCRPRDGFSEGGYPPAPGTARYDEIRPGCYDPTERLSDMDIDGVWGQLCFPNYARFAGHRFYLDIDDPDLALVCLKAYNNYLLEDWCGAAPDRLFGAAILPLNNIEEAVREFERVADLGAKAIAFSENPTVLGLPSVHTKHWDPLLAISQETGIPLCTHIGSSSKLVTTSPDAPTTVLTTLLGLNSMMAAADWLLGTALDRFPKAKIVLSEGGAGWIPYILERADKGWQDRRLDPDPALGRVYEKSSRPPSQVLSEQMYICMVDEYFVKSILDKLPIDNLMFEGDYPHGDGLWPNNRVYLEKLLSDVADDAAEKIASANFRRVFNV